MATDQVTLGAPPNDAPAFDPNLVQQTKDHIRSLVHEIAQLAQAEISPTDFFDGFLTRVVAALASVGGALWMLDDQGVLQLECQANLPPAAIEDDSPRLRHGLLLKKLLADAAPALVPPRTGAWDDDEAGNPTEFLLIVGVLRVEQKVLGLVEIFQRPGGGPATQRGYQRFLAQMCELASDYLTARKLRQMQDRQALWEQLEQFLRLVHRSLDVTETTYTLANEGRRVIGCDRVSVAVARGRGHEVTVVSGLDAIDRRAAEVRGLSQLATAVLAAREPFWYDGRPRDLSPQIERPLQAYLDGAHTKVLGIVPLYGPLCGPQLESSNQSETAKPGKPESSLRSRGQPIGALVIEQHQQGRLSETVVQRTQFVAEHGATALAKSLEHHALFLLPLWKALGRNATLRRVRSLPTAVFVLVAFVALVAGLTFVPADFDLAARGTLQPAARQDVFARHDGVVTEVAVRHGDVVTAGQALVRQKNTDLEVTLADLEGRRATTQKQLVTTQRAKHDSRLAPDEQNRLAGEIMQHAQMLESIDHELALLRQKQEDLIVRSPRRGQVSTWQVREQLEHRPVQAGQTLLSLADPDGDWELELLLPERRRGHFAAAAATGPLGVVFRLSTHPEQSFRGRVTEVHSLAEEHGEDGHVVRVRVAIDRRELPELHHGTSVLARVQCGRRALGYVWFHDFWEAVQTKVLFWL